MHNSEDDIHRLYKHMDGVVEERARSREAGRTDGKRYCIQQVREIIKT